MDSLEFIDYCLEGFYLLPLYHRLIFIIALFLAINFFSFLDFLTYKVILRIIKYFKKAD